MFKTTPLLLLLLWAFTGCQTSFLSEVAVTGGNISGTTNPTGDIHIFKGIPFAAPPVGALRWKAPQPVQAWAGTRSCDTFGPSPMQALPSPFMFWSSEFLIPAEPISEDCLHLNVWTGASAATEKRPVLVYLYGGGFRSGGSACPIYDGEAMARKGVVFVSINYRVGVFGFLAHPELSAEGEESSGNYALLDMIAALKWVQQNIAAFGGDPHNVTIAGQSAGAFGVNFLTVSPLAQGLFHQVIAQSGASFSRSSLSLAEAQQRGIAFMESLGCRSLAELRGKTAAEIQAAPGGPAQPIIDGQVIPHTVYETFAAGRQTDVPTLLGWNQDDKLLLQPLDAVTFRAQMTARFQDQAAAFFQVYPAETDAEAAASQFALSRDEAFGFPGYTWARLQSQTGQSKVYLYQFNRALPAYDDATQFGAFHSGEIVYAYDNLHTLNRPWEPVDQEIATAMSTYWVNFAKTGDPNGAGLPVWPAFSGETQRVMILDTNRMSEPLPNQDKLLFWEQYLARE